MKPKVVGFIPRLLYRLFLNLKERFDPKPPITHEEKSSVEICNKLIEKESSKLTFAPKSLKRFIKNDDFDMFIVIENRTVNLINHVYSYSVFIENDELYSDLVDKFDEELENRRQELENEIKNNIQHSLETILKKLN